MIFYFAFVESQNDAWIMANNTLFNYWITSVNYLLLPWIIAKFLLFSKNLVS